MDRYSVSPEMDERTPQKQGPVPTSLTVVEAGTPSTTAESTATFGADVSIDDGGGSGELFKIVAFGRAVSDLTASPTRPGDTKVAFSPFESVDVVDDTQTTTDHSLESAAARPIQRPESDNAEPELMTIKKSDAPIKRPAADVPDESILRPIEKPKDQKAPRPSSQKAVPDGRSTATIASSQEEASSVGTFPERGTSILDLEEGKDEKLTATVVNLARCSANLHAVVKAVRADASVGDSDQPNSDHKSHPPSPSSITRSSSASGVGSPRRATEPLRLGGVACFNPAQARRTVVDEQDGNEEEEGREVVDPNKVGCTLRFKPPPPKSSIPSPPRSLKQQTSKGSQSSDYVVAAVHASKLPDPKLIRTLTEDLSVSDTQPTHPRSSGTTRLYYSNKSKAKRSISAASSSTGADDSMASSAHVNGVLGFLDAFSETTSASVNSFQVDDVFQEEKDVSMGESDVFSGRTSNFGVLSSMDETTSTTTGNRKSITLGSSLLGDSANDDSSARRENVLNGLPIDREEAIRERYIVACRLLKSALVDDKHQLPASELAYLEELMNPPLDNYLPSDAELEALESAYTSLRKHAPITALSDQQPEPSVYAESSNFDLSIPDDAFGVVEQQSAVVLPEVGDTATWHSNDNVATFSPENRPRAGSEVNSHFSTASSELTEKLQRPLCIQLHPTAKDESAHVIGKFSTDPGVLTAPIMESFRHCLPSIVANQNFWLKYSSDQESGTLSELLPKIKHSVHTIIGVETTNGDVFGAYCSSPWRKNSEWFGSKEAFLWKLKKSRMDGTKRKFNFDNELEIFPYVGGDDDVHIQYCTEKTLAVGGGDWKGAYAASKEPVGIGFTLDGDLMGGETNSCSTFGNPKLCGTEMTEFEVSTLEVWTLTPYESAEEDEELGKLTRTLLKGN